MWVRGSVVVGVEYLEVVVYDFGVVYFFVGFFVFLGVGLQMVFDEDLFVVGQILIGDFSLMVLVDDVVLFGLFLVVVVVVVLFVGGGDVEFGESLI